MDFHSRNQGVRSSEECYGTTEHKYSSTHEAIAEAVVSEAMKVYENHLRQRDKKPSLPVMKQTLGGLAAGTVDNLIEDKGLAQIDAMKAKQMTIQVAHKIADEKYSDTTGPGGIM